MNPDPASTAPRTANESADATLSSATAGPGRVIRQARERARLGIEELASMTRLARSTLEALERDDFSTLTEAVYVRGYYRKCAKVLNLPEAELIAAYDRLYAPKSAPMPTKLLLGASGSTMSSGRSSGGGAGWAIVLVIGGLVAAMAWFLNQDASVVGPAPSAAGTEVPRVVTAIPASEPAAPVPPAPAVGAATDVAAPAAPSAAPLAAEPAEGAPTPAAAGVALTQATTLSSPPPAAGDSASPAAAAVAGSGALVLGFKSASWVRIEDADGRTLLSGTIQAGDRQVLQGRAPYSLFIGYAPGVMVEFDGQPFDLTPHVRQNSTARINLPYVSAPQ